MEITEIVLQKKRDPPPDEALQKFPKYFRIRLKHPVAP